MAGDVIIGRIAVKVMPDTDDFRDDAKRQLELIEKSLRDVRVRVELDTRGVTADAKQVRAELDKTLRDKKIRVNLDNEASVRAAIAQVKRELDRLDEKTIPLAVDREGLDAQLRQFGRDLDKAARLRLRIDPKNEKSLATAIKQIDAELARRRELSVNVKTDKASLEKTRAELAAKLDTIARDLDKAARLHLRIDPQSEKSLAKAIGQIDAELARRRELSVNVKTDRASLEKTRAELAARLDTIARARVELDNAEFARVRAEFARFSKTLKINPKLDAGKVQAKLRQIERTIEDLDKKRAELKIAVSDRDKRRVEREISDLEHKLNGLKGEVELAVKSGSRAKAKASLLALARDRTVKLIPTISKTAAARVATTLAAFSGARVAGRLLDGLWNSIRNLDRTAPLIGGVALAVAGLGAVGIASASSLASLSASLASIAPAALALPGILGGVAVALIATTVAFADFNKRIPEVTRVWDRLKQTIRDNFWSAAETPIRRLIDGLLPEFSAGMATVSAQLGKFFGNLASGLGTSLQGDLAVMFGDLSRSIDIASRSAGDIATVITVLGRTGAGYLPRLAAWFDTVTHNLATFLTTAAQGGQASQLNAWIDTAITALTDLGHVIASVGSIFYGLATAANAAGGSTLATMADTLGRVAATVNSADFQRSLIGVFVAAHQAIDNLVSQAGPALETFFSSFAVSLQTILPLAGQALGQLLAGLANALAQPAFQTGLTDLFAGIARAATALTPALGPLGQALGAIGSLLGVFLTTLAPNIAAILTTLARAAQQLAPALGPVVTLLGQGLAAAIRLVSPLLLGLVQSITRVTSGGALDGLSGFGRQMIAAWQPLVPLLGGTLKGLLSGLATVFRSLLQAGQQVGPALGQALQPVLSAMGPALGRIGSALAALIGALGPLMAQILPPLGQILGGLVTLIGQVVGALAPFAAKIIEIATAIIGPLLQALGPLLAQFLPQLGDAFTRLVTALSPVLNVLQEIATFLGQTMVPILATVVKGALDIVIAAINAVIGVIQGAVKIIAGVWDVIAGSFTGDWPRVWNGVKQIFAGVWQAIVAIFTGAWDIIVAAFKGVWQVLVSLFTTLRSAIARSWQGLWSTVQSIASTVWGWLTSAWRSTTSFLSSAGSAAWNAIRSSFTGLGAAMRSTAASMWAAIRTAFTTGVANAVALVRGLPGKAVAALGDVGSVLRSAGGQLIGGFLTGIRAKFGEVRNLLSSLTAMLPDWKGPATRDKTLLTGAGRLVMDGFIDGLESRYTAVRRSLAGLTADISAMVVTGPQVRGVDSTRLAARVTGALAADGASVTQKILNYYAAPGASVGSEEDLFAATGRARMVGW